MTDLLLHCCCGPCATFCTTALMGEGYRPVLFYANPNIHPYQEYDARRTGLAALADLRRLPLLVEPEYEPELFFKSLANAYGPERCRVCYELRLERTAAKARAMNIGRFGTTLLISPYQDHDLLMATGHRLAEAYGLTFHAVDWRPGFRASQAESKELGLYRQKYCGCLFSEKERFAKKAKAQRERLDEQARIRLLNLDLNPEEH